MNARPIVFGYEIILRWIDFNLENTFSRHRARRGDRNRCDQCLSFKPSISSNSFAVALPGSNANLGFGFLDFGG